MARRTFFSFHYQPDIWRASQVRNCWVTTDRETAGFWDAADWENVKKGGDVAIKKWIEDQLVGTSVTVVLIGAQTAERKYVIHEISRSYQLDKGMLGVRIHNMKDMDGRTSTRGENPFDKLFIEDPDGAKIYLSKLYATYDWVSDDGRTNFASWIEKAARTAGR